MVSMGDVATTTSKKMVAIPARIRKKYGLKEGRKVRFVEIGGGLFIVPILTLKELDGVGRKHARALVEGIKEPDLEHRAEGLVSGAFDRRLLRACLAKFENSLLLTTDRARQGSGCRQRAPAPSSRIEGRHLPAPSGSRPSPRNHFQAGITSMSFPSSRSLLSSLLVMSVSLSEPMASAASNSAAASL